MNTPTKQVFSINSGATRSLVDLTSSVFVIGMLFTVVSAFADPGSLTPPPGPIAPIGASLSEIEFKVIQIPTSTAISNGSPHDITQPGVYHLTENISGNIGIHTNNVILDLNGYTVDGEFNSGGYGIYIYSGGDCVIRNGTVKNCLLAGIYGQDKVNVEVENITWIADAEGTVLGNNCKIRNCRVEGNGTATNPAIQLGNGGEIIGTHVFNWGVASNANCFVMGNDVRIAGSTAEGGYNGFLGGKFNTFSDCNSLSNVAAGIICGTGDRVSHCIVHDNGGDGVFLTQGCTIKDSTIAGCGLSGVNVAGLFCHVEDNNVTANNTTTNNGSAGIVIGASKCLIEGNFLSGNGQYGLYVVSTNNSNVIMRNIALGNGASSAFNYQVNPSTNDFGLTPFVATINQPNLNGSR